MKLRTEKAIIAYFEGGNTRGIGSSAVLKLMIEAIKEVMKKEDENDKQEVRQSISSRPSHR